MHTLAAASLIALAAPAIAADNPQHQRMRDCNASAKEKVLKGDERKAFMKTCLSGKHSATIPAAAKGKPPATLADKKSPKS
ncbi:MAG: phosphate starvation-inducible protein PsiF [Rhodocyclaceae bacterium]|nr:phosphate starvation-inducible protein PsiF [Rhodocyclaceae bacterium]